MAAPDPLHSRAPQPDRRTLANALRALGMDAVERAASGHPGMPMGMADLAEVLWRGHLRHNPENPRWPDRDRFVLSNGHGSMLLYALLHLTGYPLSLDDLRNFRQLHSRTPGHPELDPPVGIETTTGPLGQGLGNAVGMALAEQQLAARYNREGHSIIDHHTYVFAGDGCLMEGVSHEACGLAGTLRLGKLIVFYDDNGISIDGETRGWFTDDNAARFSSYGWHVVPRIDGHDPEQVERALAEAKEDPRPSLLCCRTVIGFGSPGKRGTADAHGAPLGAEEIERARAELDWPHPPFEIPDGIRDAWNARARGAEMEDEWNERMDSYTSAYPDDAAELRRRLAGEMPEGFDAAIDARIRSEIENPSKAATRKHSGNTLDAIAPVLPEMLGGSADLTGSNNTLPSGATVITPGQAGLYLHYGVREFGMGVIMNGLALHGGFLPYGGTFLTFSDYMRNAIRMAALMHLRAIFVLTHDSVGLGEDGPTHQAVEHVASLRLIPGLEVWRPADGVETAIAWKCAVQPDQGPTVLALSRQGVAPLAHHAETAALCARGGYVLRDCAGEPEAILIATGSEVGLAQETAEALADVAVRVVSMPCLERFATQDAAYRDAVLPPSCRARVAVEAGVRSCWESWVGAHGSILGIDDFGLSAPGAQVLEHFGFTTENLARMVRESIDRAANQPTGA